MKVILRMALSLAFVAFGLRPTTAQELIKTSAKDPSETNVAELKLLL
jgi:hypothetical protein